MLKIGGDLIIDAGETASVHGSQVEAGGDVTIAAGDDVSITSARNAYTFHAQSSGAKDRTVDQTGQKSIASTVAAGGSVTIASGVQPGETGDPATGSVNIHGSTVKAARDVTITSAENLNITAAQDENSYRDHAIGEGMMGTGSMELDEKRSVTTTRTRIEAGDKVALTATDDVTIQAASIASGDTTDITAEEGRVAMLVTKDVEYEHYSKTKNGMFKWSFKDKGKTDETVQHTEIEAGGGLTITTAEGVVVEYRETGNVQEDIAQLAQAPGLAWMGELAKRDDIDWQAVQEVHNQWNKSDSGIGGPGMQLVSLAMALALSLTPGGQGFATGVLGLAEEGVMTAAVAAGFNALVIQAGMQVVGNGGDIGAALEALASIDTVRILATAMLTAGLMQGLENADFMKEFVGTGAAEGAEGMDKFIAHLAQKLKQNAIQAGVNTGVGTAIYGGDLGENLVANLRGAAVSAFGEAGANAIGTAYVNGDLNYVTHKIAHAALGGAMDLAMGGDGMSGVIGGAVGETVGEVLMDEIEKSLLTGQIDPSTARRWVDAGVDLSKLAAGFAAAAAGGDITAAASAGGNAAQNNCARVCILIMDLEMAAPEIIATASALFAAGMLSTEEFRQSLLKGVASFKIWISEKCEGLSEEQKQAVRDLPGYDVAKVGPFLDGTPSDTVVGDGSTTTPDNSGSGESGTVSEDQSGQVDDSGVVNQEQTPPNQMEQQRKRGQAPPSVIRVDRGKTANEKPHVHFGDGNAINNDGTWKHGGRQLTNKEKQWLKNNGWKTPNE